MTHTVSRYSVIPPPALPAVVATSDCDGDEVIVVGDASAMTVWLKAATESRVLLQRITGRHL